MSLRRSRHFRPFLSNLLPRQQSLISRDHLPVPVINGEIMQDSGSAREVAPGQFGMKWIELRSMCYKNICARRQQIAEAMRIVKKKSAESGCDHL